MNILKKKKRIKQIKVLEELNKKNLIMMIVKNLKYKFVQNLFQ